MRNLCPSRTRNGAAGPRAAIVVHLWCQHSEVFRMIKLIIRHAIPLSNGYILQYYSAAWCLSFVLLPMHPHGFYDTMELHVNQLLNTCSMFVLASNPLNEESPPFAYAELCRYAKSGDPGSSLMSTFRDVSDDFTDHKTWHSTFERIHPAVLFSSMVSFLRVAVNAPIWLLRHHGIAREPTLEHLLDVCFSLQSAK